MTAKTSDFHKRFRNKKACNYLYGQYDIKEPSDKWL